MTPNCILSGEEYEYVHAHCKSLKSLHLKSGEFTHWANNGLDHHANNNIFFLPNTSLTSSVSLYKYIGQGQNGQKLFQVPGAKGHTNTITFTNDTLQFNWWSYLDQITSMNRSVNAYDLFIRVHANTNNPF